MPSSPAGPEALRRGCAIFISGHPELPPGEELLRIGAWCRDNDARADRYGDGTLIANFERRIATLLGKEAGTFMPSGTMAQQIALRIWADRCGVAHVALHPTSHLELHEQHGYARLHGLAATLLGPAHRPTLAADLEGHPGALAALLVELPAREIGGQLPRWDELTALATVARDRGIRMHLDGARLWEAHEAYAPRSFTDIGALFDSIYVSFYKGIGALTGAMLLGPANFIDEARIWRRRHGGTLAQLHPYAASAAMRFDAQLAKMPAYHQRARTLAAALAAIPGLRILPSPPQVNMFQLYLDASAPALAVARDRIARENGAWLAQRFTASPVPGWSSLEITVGDNLLAHDDATVAPLFARLLDHARREPG